MSATNSPIRRASLIAVAIFLLLILLGPYLGIGRSDLDSSSSHIEAPSLIQNPPTLERVSPPKSHNERAGSNVVVPRIVDGKKGKESGESQSDRKFSEIEDLLGK